MTYPWASINGWLSGRPYITVSETTVITCPKTKLKCVLLYKDEPYFTAPKFAVEGKIFRYDPEADALKTDKEPWNGKIHAKMTSAPSTRPTLLIDIAESVAAEKLVRPIDEQEENESRRLWEPVTQAIIDKDYNAATRIKRQIEDAQRKLAGEREKGLVPEHQVRYFDFKTPLGAAGSAGDA
ncbi:hypothetical protein BC829DRAFT_408537, partial [Chytridium lagenaria]